MKRLKSIQAAVIWVLVLLIVAPATVFAQDAQGGAKKFSQEQLDQMIAPIALYPDSLLAQILMAATYPLEVVMAERWVKQNKGLQGDQLNDALDKQSWDTSVKALVPFPEVLAMMSEKLDWTQIVGDAFLAQESDVMDTVQQLRRRAYSANNLKSSEKQQVTVEENLIRIEPANPQVVYVPVYDPAWAYGSWWWPGYPPYAVYPYWPGVYIAPGFIAFGVGYFVGAYWGHAWGYWDWGHHSVYVNDRHNININRGNINVSNMRTTPWVHDPGHRSVRGFARSSGGAPSGLGRSSGGTMGISGGGRGPNQGRTVNPGAVSVPRIATGRSDAPGTNTSPAQYRGSINHIPSPSLSRSGGVTSRNMDSFRSIGQGSEVSHQSSWGATIRPSVPSSGWMTGGGSGTGGGMRSGGSFGGTRGGSGGHFSQGGRR
jgi:hypothetical protein